MLRNYLKVAFRNLSRRKGFTAINIIGLAIGMASALLIFRWVANELSYDRFHKNSARLYLAMNRGFVDGNIECWNGTPAVLAPTLRIESPAVERAARTNVRWFVTSAGERQMSSEGMFTDSSFLDMFSLPLIDGNAKTALSAPDNMVVTEKMAIKMFGTTNVLGKVIKIDRDDFKVTGVLKDLPQNTAFEFEYLLPWSYYVKTTGDENHWGNNSINTFVQLREGVNVDRINAQIRTISQKHSNGEVKEEIFLYPFSRWHLYGEFEGGKNVGGRISIVITFTLIAVLILLVACINFTNLTTAQSEKRAKEVGIRKVVGAARWSLVNQFIGESLLISCIAGLLSILLAESSISFFNTLIRKNLTLPLQEVWFWAAWLAFVLFTGLLAGFYPAIFLSSFQPVKVLKGTFKRAHAFINPRKILVVVQFSFAIILIVCTIIIVQQMKHAQDRQAGYTREQLVYHFLTGKLGDHFDLLKKDLLQSGVVTSVTRSLSPITQVYSNNWDIIWDGKPPGDKTVFDMYSEDEHLVKTAGMQLVAGRDMDLEQFRTDSTAVLLNEFAVKVMNLQHPIGANLRFYDKTWHVVGVVKDVVFRSPFERMFPTVITGAADNFNVINMRLSQRYSNAEAVQKLRAIFKQYNPLYPFEYHFADEEYASKFSEAQRTASFIGVFAGLTIFISCLGLFGLAAYMAETRTKEIGVRKVLGAKVSGIVQLLAMDFMKLVLLSLALACPLSWIIMNKYLENMPYHINPQWWVFALAGLLAILVSGLTVSYQAIKAAIANPVKSLRTE